MARQRLPSLRLQKASGQAIFNYKCNRTCLGKFGSKASYEAYRWFCLQLTAKQRAREAATLAVTVEVVVARWREHAAG